MKGFPYVWSNDCSSCLLFDICLYFSDV